MQQIMTSIPLTTNFYINVFVYAKYFDEAWDKTFDLIEEYNIELRRWKERVQDRKKYTIIELSYSELKNILSKTKTE